MALPYPGKMDIGGFESPKMMVLAPVDRAHEVEKVIQAGADELYCGILTPEWHDQYVAGSINRRPGGRESFTSFDELQDSVQLAHSHHVPVFLTINEHYYTQKQYPLVLDFIARATDMGIDWLIVSDLSLILTLQQMRVRPKICISVGGTTFNSETAKFYQDLGASRIILPRHLAIGEIRDIRDNLPHIELEVIILNERCPNVDGFCTFQHGLADSSFPSLYENACRLPYDITVSLANSEEAEVAAEQISWERQHIWELFHPDDFPCGACALYDFAEIGLTSVKIVGRGNPTERKINDVRFVRLLLRFLEEEKPTESEFKERAQELYTHTYQRQCRLPECYYSSLVT